MLIEGLNSNVKIYILGLLVLSLFIGSCKKSVPEEPAEIKAKSEDVTEPEVIKEPAEDVNGNVALPTELPEPAYTGIPEKILRIPNLEEPMQQVRPPFYVPEGTKNVALNKPITSSDEEPIVGWLEMITDGKKAADTESGAANYVVLHPSLQSVTIDLEAEYEIYAILLWHFHSRARVYYDVIVQAADDADFVTNVRTLFNNDDDNSAGLGFGSDKHYVESAEGKLIDAGGVSARYVRLYSNGNSENSDNHYVEVEVFGQPVN